LSSPADIIPSLS